MTMQLNLTNSSQGGIKRMRSLHHPYRKGGHPFVRQELTLPPFRSFVPGINSRDHLSSFIEQNIIGHTTDSIYITPEESLRKPPGLRREDGVIFLTLYSLKIWMGSIGNYPAASQLQLIFRIHILNNKINNNNNIDSMFIEIVVNTDEENKRQKKIPFNNNCIYKIWKRRYTFYATDPLIFLKMIQTPTNEEKKILSDMMRAEGIVLPSFLSVSLDRGTNIGKNSPMLCYSNPHKYFAYKFIKNISWKLTQDYQKYENWLKHDYWVTMIRHYPYCFDNEHDLIIYPKNFISLIPEVTNHSCLDLFQIFCNFDFFRIFDDGEYNYESFFCRIESQCIDRVYHIRCLKGISSSTGKIEVLQYELIIRMVGRKFGEQGYFYLEMVINHNENIENSLLFITRNPWLFVNVIQMGKKNEIYNCINNDEGGFQVTNNLKSKCVRSLTNYIIERENINTKLEWEMLACPVIQNNSDIPHHLKRSLIDMGPFNLIIKHWKRTVEEVTQYYSVLKDVFQKSRITDNDLIWNDEFDINNFKFSWYLHYLIKNKKIFLRKL